MKASLSSGSHYGDTFKTNLLPCQCHWELEHAAQLIYCVAVVTAAAKVLYNNSSQPGERPVIYTETLQKLGIDLDVTSTLVNC